MKQKVMQLYHVVIIGFANYDTNEKYIFEYDDIKGEPHEIKLKTSILI